MMKTRLTPVKLGLRHAVIDLGSNSIKCLIAENFDGEMHDLAELSRVTALGEDLENGAGIGEQAAERTFTALAEMKKKCEELGVDEVICVGAEALRRASNAADFIQKVEQRFGWKTRVLSPADEAELGFRASAALIPTGEQGLVIDSGGGSTEFSFGDAQGLKSWSSIPLGALTLTRAFINEDPVSPEELKNLENHVQNTLRVAFEAPKKIRVIACGGTATNLASVALSLKTFDANIIHGFHLKIDEISRQINLYSRLKTAQIAQIIGLQQGREKVILAGTVILKQIANHFELEEFIISVRGIRHALLSPEKDDKKTPR